MPPCDVVSVISARVMTAEPGHSVPFSAQPESLLKVYPSIRPCPRELSKVREELYKDYFKQLHNEH